MICLSTIEHLGVGAYEQEASDGRVDLEAIRRMRELTRPGGLLVLTTSVGPVSVVVQHGRVYNREEFDRLLEGWSITDLTLVQRRDPTTWVTIDEPFEALGADHETVAMVTGTKSG